MGRPRCPGITDARRLELHVIMLFASTLKDDEAVTVKGAESLVLYPGDNLLTEH